MVTLLSGFVSRFFTMAGEIVILCTCANDEEAGKISRHLLEKRLAACVSVLPVQKSYYWWHGAIEASSEMLLVIKSSQELLSAVESAVRGIHSYELPELLALQVAGGSADYLNWLRGNLRSGQS